jgi:hypothetical protein
VIGGKQLSAVPFNVLGQYPHGFLGDFNAFATIDRGFSNFDGGDDFSPASFAFDPKRHCGLDGIFRTLEPAVGDSMPDKILLFEGEVNPHGLSVAGPTWKSRESMISMISMMISMRGIPQSVPIKTAAAAAPRRTAVANPGLADALTGR